MPDRTSEREADAATRTSARKAGMIAKQNLQAKKKLEAMLLRQEREKSKKAFKAAQAAQAAQRKEKLRCAEMAARQRRAAAAEKEATKRKKNAMESNKGAQESQHQERSRRSVEKVSRERKASATAAKERINNDAKQTRGQALGLKIAHPTPRPIQFSMSQLASPSPPGQHVETDIMINALSCLSREVEEERDRPVLPKEDCPFSSEEQDHHVLTRVFF